MQSKEVLKFCVEKGFLLDKDILELFQEIGDEESVKLLISKLKETTSQRFLTKNVIFNNKEAIFEVFSNLPKENKKYLEKLNIKLGLNIEISKEYSLNKNSDSEQEQVFEISDKNENKDFKKPISDTGEEFEEKERQNNDLGIKVVSQVFSKSKKLNVGDFVSYFRNRFSEMSGILQEHSELKNLISINRLSGNRANVSIIGIVSNKRLTKNKNLMLDIEDLTGKIRVIINKNKPELYEKAVDIALDSILGFKGSGTREIFFANDIIFPDAILEERKRAPVEEYALFIGDMHIGSKYFLEENFQKFIDYLKGKIPETSSEVQKIKYIFIVGDIIAGVGNYPNQEEDIYWDNLEAHFEKAAELFKQIPNHIKIIISPGNHDGSRLMEPQPLLDEKYAWPLYDLKNVFLTSNPSIVNVASNKEKAFDGFNVLMYHGFSYFYYTSNISSLIHQKAAHRPELIMKYLLKNRHLAPTHASLQYFPMEKDAHLIREIPDIFVSGHIHKSAVSYYNNILLISVSGWEQLTPYMEKRGAQPDFCKVPMLNLKTRAVKVLDFE
ncbi:metallophosphoesterase [Candidatus Pacearchaeota archaeon]|nr:metallophosphoesterase [Candidatus Pacearchaeota archaeon]